MALYSIRRSARRRRITPTYITVCAWCGKVRDGDRWSYAAALPESAEVTHGICPDCLQRQIEQVGKAGKR